MKRVSCIKVFGNDYKKQEIKVSMTIKLKKLNLPFYKFQFIDEGGQLKIYDNIRKKALVLTPEEWVRQNFIRYVLDEKKYPASRLSIEHSIKVNGLNKRCDAVFFNKTAKAEILFEFKAPEIAISHATLIQSGIYNAELKAKLLVLSNGLTHYIIKPNYETNQFEVLQDIPEYGIFI